MTKNRLSPGNTVTGREMTTIHGEPVDIPQAGLTHLQFRRYSGCPVCNLHLRSFSLRHESLLEAGIQEVVVFHSSVETMLQFQGELPFAVVADPERKLYEEFGVGSILPLAALDPRSFRAAFRALTRAESLKGATGKGEDHLGAPADFLVDASGVILAAKYGKRVDDHWSMDEVLGMAAAAKVPAV